MDTKTEFIDMWLKKRKINYIINQLQDNTVCCSLCNKSFDKIDSTSMSSVDHKHYIVFTRNGAYNRFLSFTLEFEIVFNDYAKRLGKNTINQLNIIILCMHCYHLITNDLTIQMTNRYPYKYGYTGGLKSMIIYWKFKIRELKYNISKRKKV